MKYHKESNAFTFGRVNGAVKKVRGEIPPLMHSIADPAGAKPRRDRRFISRVSRHEVPKTAGYEAKKSIRPRQSVALIRESVNRCDTLTGSRGRVRRLIHGASRLRPSTCGYGASTRKECNPAPAPPSRQTADPVAMISSREVKDPVRDLSLPLYDGHVIHLW